MKNTLLLLLFAAILISCTKDPEIAHVPPPPDPPCTNIKYMGSYDCPDGYVAVATNRCCPVATPYFCYKTNRCYQTCLDAAEDCENQVIRGNNDPDANVPCSYKTYSGPRVCGSSEVAVTDNYCCPKSKPYFCTSTGGCYTTCDAAQTPCSGNVVKGK